MESALLLQLNAERAARRAVVLVTDLADGGGRLVLENETVDGALGEAVEAAFRSRKSTSVDIGDRSLFINLHLPPPRFLMIGAVHISQTLAPMASAAGFACEIIDPRSAFATAERFPGVRLRAEWPEDVLASEPLDSYTAVAALTHDAKIDDFALKAALDAQCFYVGALGSRKTHGKRIERLAALGASPEQVERVHAPIGLDIGAATPAEIAVSILAEIIGAMRSRRRPAAPAIPA